MDIPTLSLLIAIIGCCVGVSGWISGREKRTAGDSEWRGEVNAKLDSILGIRQDVVEVQHEVHHQDVRLTAVEASAKQAHKRIDRLEGREDREDK